MSQFKIRELKPKETIGELLRRRRESLSLTLSIVAKELKIQEKYLRAIENGDYKNLPADVYAKGFLRSYAKRLGLSVDRVMSVYRRERAIELNVLAKGKKENRKPRRLERQNLVITPKTLAAAGLVFTGGLLLLYLTAQFFAFLNPPKLVVISPEDAETLVEGADSIYIEGSTDPGADVFINNFQIKVGVDGTFGETVTLKEGINIIEIKAVSKLNKVTSVTKKVFTTREAAVLKEFEDSLGKINGVKATISMKTSRSLIEVWIDGKPVFGGKGSIFEPGVKKTFSAKRTIKIKAGNAGAVGLLVSNSKVTDYEIETLGKTGQIVTVEFRFDQALGPVGKQSLRFGASSSR